ncbi:MAG TPA: HAMP domain-containing sensor histidine kinase [Vicinamibacterales bacterium]
MRRTLWQAALGAALLALLATLATLQYRWLGDVSNAERDRLRASLRTRASDLSRAFDREITHLYLAFHVEGEELDRDPAGRLSAAYDSAQQPSAASGAGGLVRGVFLVDARGEKAGAPQRLNPETRTLEPADWPPAFDVWKRLAASLPPPAPGFPPPFFMADAVDAATPALVVPVPITTRLEEGGGSIALTPDPRGVTRTIIVWLDADRLRALVESLVVRFFGTSDESEFYVTIAKRDPQGDVVYSSAPAVNIGAGDADVATGIFDLRLDELYQFNVRTPSPPTEAAGAAGMIHKDRLAITIVRRATGPDGPRLLMSGGEDQGLWRVFIRYKSGSLDALVARSRTRNLAIGLGVLALLAAGFVFVIGSALRQQRLARQQIEFVAAVSHELRTPLAVIRSAAENLADGVVGDGAQVRRYGSLIRSEGIRLSDMVERVMEYAGINAGTARPHGEVDVARLVDEAVAMASADARDRDIRVDTFVAKDLPAVSGDADALGSAVQNVLANAIKYSPRGSSIDLRVEATGDQVRIIVGDHGLGIDADDLPHIFKPFYRGQRARDAQIRGTGVGLSVVRHVVDAHQGDVQVASGVGEGTTVALTLRAIPRSEAAMAEARATT